MLSNSEQNRNKKQYIEYKKGMKEFVPEELSVIMYWGNNKTLFTISNVLSYFL